MGRMRRNGFQAPMNNLQVATWALFPVLCGAYYGLVVLPLETPLAVTAGVLYGVWLVAALGFGYWTTAVDPMDPKVRKQMEDHPNRQVRSVPRHADDERFCIMCVANTDSSSEHCRFCDKCIHGFDHHCKWLNNCIGRANYRTFFATVTSVLLVLVTHFVFTVVHLVQWAEDETGFEDRVKGVYGPGLPPEVFLAFLCGFGATTLVLSAAVAQLFFFHVFLISKGLTTYDYILQH